MKKLYLFLAVIAMAMICPSLASAQQTQSQVSDSIQAIYNKAKDGDAAAQNIVGTWYYEGRHKLPVNFKEATKWWSRSAKQGNVEATGNLGICYAEGHGVAQNFDKATSLLNKSLKTGQNKALFDKCVAFANDNKLFYCNYVASCYKNGIGTAKNLNNAITYFEKAANLGSVDAMREVAFLYLSTARASKAFAWFEKGMNDDVVCLFNYGKMLMEGNGVQKDQQKGFNALLSAAKQNYPEAQYWVGCAYYDGNGVVRSAEQGAEWMIKAANAGVGQAQYRLGMAYVNGQGVDIDFDLASRWFAVCSTKGNFGTDFQKAINQGGDLFHTSYHTYLKGLKYYYEKDYNNAIKAFQSIKKDNKKVYEQEGKAMEGYIYLNPAYEKHDTKKGLKLLQESADLNNSLAQYLLGMIYDGGAEGITNVVEKNIPTAIAYLEKAAAKHYGPAACYLGDMYFEGRGVSQSYSTAVDYYMSVKAMLTPGAQKRLAECYENGMGGLEISKDEAKAIRDERIGGLRDILKYVPLN